jgi:hypothetical protein
VGQPLLDLLLEQIVTFAGLLGLVGGLKRDAEHTWPVVGIGTALGATHAATTSTGAVPVALAVAMAPLAALAGFVLGRVALRLPGGIANASPMHDFAGSLAFVLAFAVAFLQRYGLSGPP